MRRLLAAALLVVVVNAACSQKGNLLWNFTCTDLSGTAMNFQKFAGKVVLIENTASM
jgi:hypothetical protein